MPERRTLGDEGETNTGYDVRGHALVQFWGNFELQQVTWPQLASAAWLCAWICQEHSIPPGSGDRPLHRLPRLVVPVRLAPRPALP